MAADSVCHVHFPCRAVGPEAAKYVTHDTQIIDAKDKLVIPGESHTSHTHTLTLLQAVSIRTHTCSFRSWALLL